ncbi:hypothetical protein MLD38_019732 [Melastoma candidum]|uniref:Uncharacterized protein n=1 Tax=Melastoma candidum TaxID=119954 RepID=A0ACB9QY48_9MYRT|nr:hypothetical protein MLD38_019732 [Melastoma candidum]
MSGRSGSRDSVNQPSGSGCANTIGRGRAGPSNKALSGMILVNGWDAIALFDTGANHSFISQSFVEENGFMVDMGGGPLRVWLRNGENDYDIILGMDWLMTCHAMVDCVRKEILLGVSGQPAYTYVGESYQGDGIPLVAVVEAQRILRDGGEAFLAVMLNLKEELPSLQDIPVVQDYEDVFPEEFPGLPPSRDNLRN